jgi:DNA-binding NarL/FixJ family response regulator
MTPVDAEFTNRPLRIVLADDHEIFRRALAALLEGSASVQVVGDAADGREAIDRVLQLDPDVAVLDVVMPRMDGIEAARRIRALRPRTEVVILSAFRSEAYQRQALQAGVRAYLLKECSLEMLLDGIRHAAHGDYFLPGVAGQDLVAEYVRPLIRNQNPGGLVTPRERQIACLLADGYSTKEAAAVLNMSVKTAETHRASIMRKLGAKNVADIVKYCIRNHLIDV